MTRSSRLCTFCGCLVLLVATIYYHHPSERFLGQTDVSSYLYSALAIARGEGLAPRQPLLDAMPAEVRSTVVQIRAPLGLRDASPNLRQRPFFLEWQVGDKIPGNLVPRFPPGYSVVLALGYRLAGWNGILAVNGMLMLLAGMMVMYLAGKWAGPVAGLFAAVLWAVFPLNVWIANTTLAEPLVLLLGLSAVVAWVRSRDSKAIFWPIFIGISVGVAPLVKLDAIPWLVLPLAYAWENRRKGIWSAFQPTFAMGLCLIGSAVVLLAAESGYAAESLAAMVRQPVVWVAVGLAVVFFLVACFFAVRLRIFSKTDQLEQLSTAVVVPPRLHLWLKPTTFVILITGLAYFYFIRSRWAGADQIYWDPWGKVVPSLREVTLLRLGWYLPPVVLWVAMASASAALLWAKEAWMRSFAMVGVAVLFFVSYDNVNFPVQPSACRRFMPQVVPVLFVTLAGASVWLKARIESQHWRGVIVGLIFLYATVHGLNVNAKMNSHSNADGLFEKVRDISATVGPKAIVLLRQSSPFSEIAPLLSFGFGCDVLSLRIRSKDDMQAVENYLKVQEQAGRTIWLWTSSADDRMGFRGRPDGAAVLKEFTVPFMHMTTKEAPFTWDDTAWTFSLRKISITTGSGPTPVPKVRHQ